MSENPKGLLDLAFVRGLALELADRAWENDSDVQMEGAERLMRLYEEMTTDPVVAMDEEYMRKQIAIALLGSKFFTTGDI